MPTASESGRRTKITHAAFCIFLRQVRAFRCTCALKCSHGVCGKDEFTDTDGCPINFTIREARRMIFGLRHDGENCRESIVLPDPVGLAAYTMDSHNCRRIVKNGKAEKRG